MIAIVGAGATGVACLIQLVIKLKVSRNKSDIEILLFDKTDFGPGLAYGTGETGHLLNTRARLMGIMPGEPMHFVEWMQTHEKDLQKSYPGLTIGPDSYPPRTLYGEYLSQMLSEHRRFGEKAGIKVRLIKSAVNDADLSSTKQWSLITEDGQQFTSDYLILATGNPQPSAFGEIEHHANYISSPWPTSRLLNSVRDKNARVGVIGSSLTAIDSVISLVNNGHAGPICLFSKEGYLPRVQFRKEKEYERQVLTLGTIRKIIRERGRQIRVVDLIRLFREEAELASGQKIDWKLEDRAGKDARDLLSQDLKQAKEGESWFQQILYSLRYDAYSIWQLLNADQKLLYTKWIKTFVDVNRHAIPLENGEKILKLFGTGQLLILGNSKDIEPTEDGFILKNAENRTWEADYIVNAAGPAALISKMDDMPLLRSLLEKELIEEYPAGGV
ncbi:MAG: FAD/NAD(P)-binding protein, partial [Flavitalea sp.]